MSLVLIIWMRIDKHINWNMYVNKLCSDVSLKLKQLRRLVGFVSPDLLAKVYHSTVQPCIAQTTDQNIGRIQRLQNQAARVISNNFDFINCRGLDIVKLLKWMNIRQRCTYFTIVLMFKCIHGLCPNYLCDSITMQFDVSGLSTRSHPMNVYVPRPN